MANQDPNVGSYLDGAFRVLWARQMVVRDTPEHAVEVGVGYLAAYGFRVRPGDVTTALRAEGSPWVAKAVEIGKDAGALRGCLYSLISDTPLALVMKRTIPPTLVIVAARTMPDGSCVLAIQPFFTWFSKKRLARVFFDDYDFGADRMAAPQVAAAITAVINAYQGVGTLVDAGRPTPAISDKEAMTTILRVRKLTGW